MFISYDFTTTAKSKREEDCDLKSPSITMDAPSQESEQDTCRGEVGIASQNVIYIK